MDSTTDFPAVGTPSELLETIEVSDRGTAGVGVFIQDQTTPPLGVKFLKERSEPVLAADTVIDTRTVTLVAGHGALVGDTLEFATVGSGVFMQALILIVNVNLITIDSPINAIYTVAGSVVVLASDNILVDGSVTPQIFSVLPLPNQLGDMVRIIIEIRGTTFMDFTTFGSDAPLTNGCVVRVKNPDGTFRNLLNFKSNSDFIQQAFDHDFFINNANNVRGFTARLTWGGQSKHGVVIRLDGSLGEELQLIVQDNLTAGDNTRFHLIAQGHEVQ